MKVYLALFKNNMRLTLRDRGVLFFNYLFPLIFFFGFAEMFHAGVGAGIAYFVSTVLVMGILGNGLWGAGMRSVQEREANILRRFKVTPISPLPILVAAMVSGWLLFLPALFLLVGLAHFLYAMPMPQNWFSLFLMASLGVCSLRAIGLILAAVTNTMAEATIAIQSVYMPMLFLSGATVPAAMLPKWAQTLAQFMPASYLVSGFQGIFFRNQNLWDNAAAVAALLLTTVLGLFLAVQLFRWEKEEKIRPRNKLWVVAVLAPFVLMGSWQSYSKEHLGNNAALYRDLQRSGVFLIRNTRIFVGDGKVIENGAVLVRDGKIAAVYEGTAPDPEQLKAEIIEGAGKTLLPGLIDAHVHLAASGGLSTDPQDSNVDESMPHSAAALLYSGVTAARSVGDGLDASLKLRKSVADGAKLGAQLFVCGPMFTAEGGHGTEFVQHLPGRDQGFREGAVGAHAEDARGGAQTGARAEVQRGRRHQGDPRSRLGRGNALRPAGSAAGPRRVRGSARAAPAAGDPHRRRARCCRCGGDRQHQCGTRIVARRDSRSPAGAHGEGGRLSRPDARGGRGVRAVLRRQGRCARIIRWCSRWCRRGC